MDALQLLELTDNLTDALEQLSGVDQDDALAVLDAVEAVQLALEAMGEDRADVAPTTDQAETNPVYQSILDGAPLTRDLLTQAIAEVEKDPTHWQVKPVYDSLVQQVEALENAA